MNSAPEYWTFSEKDAVRREKDTFVFSVRGQRSHNGTPFTTRPTQVTLLLDFGPVRQVGVAEIVSLENP